MTTTEIRGCRIFMRGSKPKIEPIIRVMSHDALLLYDGACGLCDSTVRFIQRRDPAGAFSYLPLQHPESQKLLAHYSLPSNMSTVVLIAGGRAYTQSTVLLHILRRLPFPWPIAAMVLAVIPRALRDMLYALIARYRRVIFGSATSCPMPPSGRRLSLHE